MREKLLNAKKELDKYQSKFNDILSEYIFTEEFQEDIEKWIKENPITTILIASSNYKEDDISICPSPPTYECLRYLDDPEYNYYDGCKFAKKILDEGTAKNLNNFLHDNYSFFDYINNESGIKISNYNIVDIISSKSHMDDITLCSIFVQNYTLNNESCNYYIYNYIQSYVEEHSEEINKLIENQISSLSKTDVKI